MTLQLALNTTALLSPLTGIGQYVFHLATELVQQQLVDPDFFYTLYWSKELHNAAPLQTNQLIHSVKKYLPYSYILRRAWQTHKFRSHTRTRIFDLYHEPNYLLLPFDGPQIVTVHDLSWIHYPELHPIERVRSLNKYFEASLNQATHILTDSEFVRQELIQLFSIKPDRIQAIHLGVESLFKPQTALETHQTLSYYKLNYNSYLLTVGTLEPRKNLITTLRAYSQLPKALRQQYPLIIVGMKGWHTDTLEQTIRPLVNSGEIRLLGYIPREHLAAITAGATTLIYPSLYEGFGLPPLEAMACGIPPIVSNTSSLPEVVSSGGIQLPPMDESALIAALKCLIEGASYRQSLGNQAFKIASKMSWQQCAAQTYQAYQHTLSIY